MNCPFYGRALFLAPPAPQRQTPPFILFNTQGNQCALVTTRHSPCLMEIENQVPDWKLCIMVREVRIEETV